MTSEDYRFMVTLVLSVAGLQTTIIIAVIGFLIQSVNKRLELIENRLDKIENRKLV